MPQKFTLKRIFPYAVHVADIPGTCTMIGPKKLLYLHKSTQI